MEHTTEKTVTIRIYESTRKRLKIKSAQLSKSMVEYMDEVIKV